MLKHDKCAPFEDRIAELEYELDQLRKAVQTRDELLTLLSDKNKTIADLRKDLEYKLVATFSAGEELEKGQAVYLKDDGLVYGKPLDEKNK